MKYGSLIINPFTAGLIYTQLLVMWDLVVVLLQFRVTQEASQKVEVPWLILEMAGCRKKRSLNLRSTQLPHSEDPFEGSVQYDCIANFRQG